MYSEVRDEGDSISREIFRQIKQQVLEVKRTVDGQVDSKRISS